MKKSCLVLAIAAAIFSAQASAEELIAEATAEQGLPLHFIDGEVQNLDVAFPASFSSISLLCFTPYFSGDLLDPGEVFYIGPFPSDNGSTSFGWRNIGTSPAESRKVCTSSNNEIDLFLDGEQRFGLRIDSGEATLSSLTVSITGEIDEVLPEPRHSVTISLDEGAGIVPAEGGQVPYSATLGNPDFETSYKTLTRWSVLSFPDGTQYPVQKARPFDVDAGAQRHFRNPQITVPEWFPAGEYTFTWYVADPLNNDNTIVQDTLSFTKLITQN